MISGPYGYIENNNYFCKTKFKIYISNEKCYIINNKYK